LPELDRLQYLGAEQGLSIARGDFDNRFDVKSALFTPIHPLFNEWRLRFRGVAVIKLK